MKSTQVLFRKNPLFDKCPSCSEYNTLHRSRARSTKESLLKNFTFFKTYRCKTCGWRGNLSTFSFGITSLKYLLFYLVLIIAVAFVINEILKRLA